MAISPESITFSLKRNSAMNHTQPLTLQKFIFKAEDQNKSNQLFIKLKSDIQRIKSLIGIDIDTFNGLQLNIRKVRKKTDYLMMYVTFHQPFAKVASTPTSTQEAVGSTNIKRKNEAEVILGVKGNNIFAGIMIANWNSLRRHLTAILEAITELDLAKTPITNFPNNDFFRKVANEKIVAYGVAANMSLANLESSITEPSILTKILKPCSNKKKGKTVTGHILIDAKLNPTVISDDVGDVLETTDLEQYLDEENFLLTASNKKLYPRDFLDRTTYYAMPLNDKTILCKYAFDILEHHITNQTS